MNTIPQTSDEERMLLEIRDAERKQKVEYDYSIFEDRRCSRDFSPWYPEVMIPHAVCLEPFKPLSEEDDCEIDLEPGHYAFRNADAAVEEDADEPYCISEFGIDIAAGLIRTRNELLRLIAQRWRELAIDPEACYLKQAYCGEDGYDYVISCELKKPEEVGITHGRTNPDEPTLFDL